MKSQPSVGDGFVTNNCNSILNGHFFIGDINHCHVKVKTTEDGRYVHIFLNAIAVVVFNHLSSLNTKITMLFYRIVELGYAHNMGA